MTSATTEIIPLTSYVPPLKLTLNYFQGEAGRPRSVAEMPGDGPTWVSGYTALRDRQGQEHLVGVYVKIKPPLEAYECGLCEWSPEFNRFERVQKIWTKSDAVPQCPSVPDGHPALVTDAAGQQWIYFGNPLPHLRCPAVFEDWQNPETWESLKSPQALPAIGQPSVVPHTGSVAWNAYRRRWVTVFMEKFGKPSAFGELWYAEAEQISGPWGPAIKILSHDNYTFYNPRIHSEWSSEASPILLFEGTYTVQFANHPVPIPRYDYNQILYRLDLDDPALKPAEDQ